MRQPKSPTGAILPLPRGRQLRVIKWRLQTLVTEITLQRLPYFAGWHKDHHFPCDREAYLAQLGDDLCPLSGRHVPPKKRDVRPIYSADENLGITHS